MAFIPAPNAIRLCLQFVWEGQIVEFCIGILKNSAVTGTDLDDVITGMEAWRVAELRPLYASSVVATQWKATSLATATSPAVTTLITSNGDGLESPPTVPNNSTLTCTFYTDLRGRSYRGRIYFPGMCMNQLTSSTEADPAFAVALATAFSEINANLPTGFVHCVISYQNNNVMRTTAARTPVTAYAGELRLDSQRRRLEGRGL